MEQKSLKELAEKLTAEDNPTQKAWENKEYGCEEQYVKKAPHKKKSRQPSSIRWPEDLFNDLISLAEFEGIGHQKLVKSILTKEIRRRKEKDLEFKEFLNSRH